MAICSHCTGPQEARCPWKHLLHPLPYLDVEIEGWDSKGPLEAVLHWARVMPRSPGCSQRCAVGMGRVLLLPPQPCWPSLLPWPCIGDKALKEVQAAGLLRSCRQGSEKQGAKAGRE